MSCVQQMNLVRDSEHWKRIILEMSSVLKMNLFEGTDFWKWIIRGGSFWKWIIFKIWVLTLCCWWFPQVACSHEERTRSTALFGLGWFSLGRPSSASRLTSTTWRWPTASPSPTAVSYPTLSLRTALELLAEDACCFIGWFSSPVPEVFRSAHWIQVLFLDSVVLVLCDTVWPINNINYPLNVQSQKSSTGDWSQVSGLKTWTCAVFGEVKRVDVVWLWGINVSKMLVIYDLMLN